MSREIEVKKTFDRWDMDQFEFLPDFINFLTEELSNIPEEYRGKTVFEIDPMDRYGDPDYKINISYRRPETDSEKNIREERDRLKQEFEEKKERKIFELLKKKYEG